MTSIRPDYPKMIEHFTIHLNTKPRSIMPHIPDSIKEQCPPIKGLILLHRGKVRDTYLLPDYPDLLLVVASDRVSVFDCVLNGLITNKGAILTAMSHFSTKRFLEPFFKTDFVACGANIDGYLPEQLRNNPDLQKRAMVVKKFESPQIEDIVRFHLTGSGFKDYAKTGKVCGHSLPPGLIDGSRLPTPLYTPSTKATEGHDQNIDVHDVTARWGMGNERLSLMAAGTAYQYAHEKGIILADTKLEMNTVFIDEKFTPDSSRFWDQEQWEVAHAKGKLPPPMDKQVVRDYILKEFKTRNMEKPDPSIPYHLVVLDNLRLPDHIIQRTHKIYRYIFWRLVGKKLEAYQANEMKINVSLPKPKVWVILGEHDDTLRANSTFGRFSQQVDLHINNIESLSSQTTIPNPDVIIVAATGYNVSKLDRINEFLVAPEHHRPPVIGVALEGPNPADNYLGWHILERSRPGIINNDNNGKLFYGQDGLSRALAAAIHDEFKPN